MRLIYPKGRNCGVSTLWYAEWLAAARRCRYAHDHEVGACDLPPDDSLARVVQSVADEKIRGLW